MLFIAVAAIAAAIVKPWDVPAPPPGIARATQAIPVTAPPDVATPSHPPAIVDPNAMICLTHQSEQVLTLERWDDREIKSWSPPTGAAPLGAGGDGVTIASTHVVGIGVCPGVGSPAGLGSAPGPSEPPRDAVAWFAAVVTNVQALDPGGIRDLGEPPRITVESDYIAAGVLYGAPDPDRAPATSTPPSPPVQAAPTLPFWQPGRYGITYYFPGDPAQELRFVMVDIRRPMNDG